MRKADQRKMAEHLTAQNNRYRAENPQTLEDVSIALDLMRSKYQGVKLPMHIQHLPSYRKNESLRPSVVNAQLDRLLTVYQSLTQSIVDAPESRHASPDGTLKA